MKKAFLLFTILFCCMLNVLAQEQIEPEEYEVYKAWLEERFLLVDTQHLFIMKFTADHHDDFNDISIERRKKLTQLKSSTLKDYRLRNRKSLELENKFEVKANVKLIPENLVTFLRSGAAYEDFVKKSGAEYGIAFSRVGFNKKRNQALIHVNYRSVSEPKFAFGFYFLLAKKKDNWIVKQKGQSWEY